MARTKPRDTNTHGGQYVRGSQISLEWYHLPNDYIVRVHTQLAIPIM